MYTQVFNLDHFSIPWRINLTLVYNADLLSHNYYLSETVFILCFVEGYFFEYE